MLTKKSLMSIGVSKIPLCGDILKVFVYACQVKTAGVKKNFENVAAQGGGGGTCLRQLSRVNFCSADSSRVRQALSRLFSVHCDIKLRPCLYVEFRGTFFGVK